MISPASKSKRSRVLGIVLSLVWGLGACTSSSHSDSEPDGSSSPWAGSGSNRECTADSDCPTGEACAGELKVCRTRCTVDTHCPEPSVCHDELRVCVRCQTSEDCGGAGVCHPEWKSCVQCLSADHCKTGLCNQGRAACVQCLTDQDCPSGHCSLERGQCVQCLVAPHCDDADDCTVDSCPNGKCAYSLSSLPECISKVELCTTKADCKAGNFDCAGCNAGVCSYQPVDVCSDKFPCVPSAHPCKVAVCAPNECNQRVCMEQEIEGCQPPTCITDADCHTRQAEDGCPLRCQAGRCEPHDGTGLPCECVRHSDCPETGPCQFAVCENFHCHLGNLADDIPCDDGNACTVGEQCSLGACEPAAPAECDDGNACTTDTCVPSLGCVFGPVTGAPCDDGSFCTQGDVCGNGECLPGFLVQCSDEDPCTDDLCEPALGCVFTSRPEGAACNDGNPCTGPDQCQSGLCVGPEVVCATDKICQTAYCHPTNGCSSELLPDGSGCDDGNPCTISTVCVKGSCTGAVAVQCNTNDPCLFGVCGKSGCEFVPFPVPGKPCDDGNACTKSDACFAGNCVGGSQVICKDDNPCTLDVCSPGVGCAFPPALDNAMCDDGDSCTHQDRCLAGKCVGTPIVCNDGNPCTFDQCKAGVCQFTPLEDNTECEPALACATGGVCANGECNPSGIKDICIKGIPVCSPPTQSCQDTTDCPNGAECVCLGPFAGEELCALSVCVPASRAHTMPSLCAKSDMACVAKGDICVCPDLALLGGSCDWLVCLPAAACGCATDADCEAVAPGCGHLCNGTFCIQTPDIACPNACPAPPLCSKTACKLGACGPECAEVPIEGCGE